MITRAARRTWKERGRMAEKPQTVTGPPGDGPRERRNTAPERRVFSDSRRRFLKIMTMAVGAVSVLAAAVPGMVALAFPTRRRTVRQPEGALDAGDAKAV